MAMGPLLGRSAPSFLLIFYFFPSRFPDHCSSIHIFIYSKITIVAFIAAITMFALVVTFARVVVTAHVTFTLLAMLLARPAAEALVVWDLVVR